jgi:hypothetical protein
MITLNELYKYISAIDKVYEYRGYYYLFTVPIDNPNGSRFWKMKIGTDILELIEYADYVLDTGRDGGIEVDPSVLKRVS